jgi:hypothetical protein
LPISWKNIHIHENYATLTLLKNKRILASKKVMILALAEFTAMTWKKPCTKIIETSLG